MSAHLSPTPPPTSQLRQQPGRVLVVDDEAANRELIRDALSANGHLIEEAANASEAFRCIASHRPDVVLLDVSMPGMDGFEVCRRLRAVPETAGLPIIMVSAFTDRRDRIAGIEAGANDYLGKPIDVQDLILRVRNAIVAKRLADEVRRNYVELKRQVELRENLTHMLVHDLRSPLGAMQLSVELVRTTASGRLNEAECDSLRVAQRSISRMIDMVSAILDVSRLEAGEMVLRKTACNLARLAAAAIEPFSVSVPGQCRLSLAPAPEPVLANCDPELITRVIGNFVGNAVKFAPPDGMVVIRATHRDARPCLEVSDNGRGIDPALHRKIFEKFGQVENGMKRHSTGLGLYFCKLVAEAHGGAIGVQSESGRGSTFWVTLPPAT